MHASFRFSQHIYWFLTPAFVVQVWFKNGKAPGERSFPDLTTDQSSFGNDETRNILLLDEFFNPFLLTVGDLDHVHSIDDAGK